MELRIADSLTRFNGDEQKTSVIVAGAGAVENAWQPILKALEPWYDFPLEPDGANSFFARVVYLLRWWKMDHGEESKQTFESWLKKLTDIKRDIARELKLAEADGKIKARPSLALLMEKLVVGYSPCFGLVTTNWDTVVPQAIGSVLGADYEGSVEALHLHGSVANPDTLYLPSEVIREPYRQPHVEHEIGVMHSTVVEKIRGAQRTILYGLSIDPLDAELSQVLSAAWNCSSMEEILIVDPQHGKIAHRVNLLVARHRNVRIVGINPNTMAEEKDYTIRKPGRG
jgi:hypothetical protein